MSLTTGSRIGPYEIGAAIGAGGMGEVYRATDTKLKRQVAIKVLPASLAVDAERLARFQREAEVLAALNHPHVAAIYGLEEKDGVTALVMELVDGDDLSRLIPPGGLPVTEALPIAMQIAEALEAAHEQGIIHRDLKPANVKVRPDGTVKVLDFGLAKLTDQGSGIREQGSGDLVNSPTITSPAMTMRGVILGTAAYMSPEQARGRIVDKRTDIWAFGAVLYEMLTGTRAFEGEDVSLTLAAVMKSDPDFSALPADLPPAIRACLVRCLHKDPRQRLRDIGDVRLAFDGAFDSPAQAPAHVALAASKPALWRRVVPPLAAAIAAGALMGVAAWNAKPTDPRPVTRFEHLLPADVTFRGGARRVFTVSSDGRRIAYAALDGLYLHALDEVGDRKLVESAAGIQSPTFSPDGDAVAYWENGQLKRIAAAGGAPVVIAASPNPVGISWGSDNALLYALPDGINRVSAQGGMPELLVKVGVGEFFTSPQLLPGGDAVLFTVTPVGAMPIDQAESLAVVHSLRSGERTLLVQGAADARYLPSGHLLYTVGDGLFGVGLDLSARQTVGGAVSLVQGIRRGSGAVATTLADFDASANGSLFYVSTANVTAGSQLVWVDRRGRPEVVASIAPQEFAGPRLSADGRRVLVAAQGDLRIYDLATGRETRVTSDRSALGYAEWVPGDRAVVYTSTRKGERGVMNIWLQPLDGSGRATQLTKLEGQMHMDALSPDGRTLAAHQHKAQSGVDLLVFPVADGAAGEPTPFMAGPADEESGVFSPDGRFIAYLDAVSGREEVVIRPFPGPGPETPVSVGGGREPAWARNGELFYRRTSDDMLMVVRVTTSPALGVDPPRELFRGSGVTSASPRANYSVTADGQRFLTPGFRVGSSLPGGASTPRPRITIVLNWVEELKRRIPRN